MIKDATLEQQVDSWEKFPYRFLLRWTWPEHIDRVLRRLMWSWLKETAGDSADVPSDFVATHLFWLISVSPETPGAVLDALCDSSSSAFAERIAENPNTWPSTLVKLASHPVMEVRQAVADNVHTPAGTILLLANDESPDIRYTVAENHNQSLTILETLADDENCYVAARSKKTINRVKAETGELAAPTEVRPRASSKNKRTATA